jgi:hypothetical protein
MESLMDEIVRRSVTELEGWKEKGRFWKFGAGSSVGEWDELEVECVELEVLREGARFEDGGDTSGRSDIC